MLRYNIGDVLKPEPGSDHPSRLKVTGIRIKKEAEQMYLVYEGNEIGRDGHTTGRKIVFSTMPEDFPNPGENDNNEDSGEINDPN